MKLLLVEDDTVMGTTLREKLQLCGVTLMTLRSADYLIKANPRPQRSRGSICCWPF